MSAKEATHGRRQHSWWSGPSPPGGTARLATGTPRWRPPLSSGPTSVWRQPSLSAALRGRQRAVRSFWHSGCESRICAMLLQDTATLRLDLPPPRAVLVGSPPDRGSAWWEPWARIRSEASSPNSLGPERDWPEVRGEECRPRTVLYLATGKMGRGREWGGRASHTVVPWTWEPGGKGNCSFFEKVGTAGPWTSGGTETKRNRRFSSRPSTGGRSGAVLASLLRKSKLQHLRVARVRAASSTSWTTWGLAGTRGAPLSCERLDAPAYVSIWPGAEQLWRTQEGTHGDGQTEAWPRGQRWMVHHAGAGCAGSPRSAAVPPRTAGRSPRRCRRTALPGRCGVEKACLVDILHLCQVEPEMAHPGPPWLTSPSRVTAPWLSSSFVMNGRHPIYRWCTKWNAGCPVGQTSEITREPGWDVRCVRSKRSVGACPAERLLQ